MLNIAIVEKRPRKRSAVAKSLKGLDIGARISQYYDQDNFREQQAEGTLIFDAVFINPDINGEGDGVEFARALREANKKIMICFIAETDKYYKEAFEVFATGYLQYPIESGEIYKCISFYFQDSNFERRATWTIKEKGGVYRRLFCRNIRYIESNNRELSLHMEDGSIIECYGKLDEAQSALPGGLFVRCHQSYIISMYFADSLEDNSFIMGDEEIPISRRYKKNTKELYKKYSEGRRPRHQNNDEQ